MDNNPYPDDFEQASECLRLALALLARHGIAPSPLNYRLAYEYVSGKNRELKDALDALLGQAEGVRDEQLLGLYRKTFSANGEALEMTRDELCRLVGHAEASMRQSGSNLDHYRGVLEQFAELLGDSQQAGSVMAEVKRVLKDTRNTEQAQRRYGSELSELSDEVETLRSELEQVREESKTDMLTGIANRRAFDAALGHSLKAARDDQRPFCLLLCDIDHFKQFNDTYGHLVGDKVLRFVANTLRRSVKGKDTVARYGGEEFAIILPETPLAGANHVAEQIRTAISAGNLKDKNGEATYGRITVSIGVARFDEQDTADSLVRRADEALYLAKERGRNRVEDAA